MKRALSLLLVLALAAALAPMTFAADEYGIGEVWTVDGAFSLEILKVTETDERNKYSDENPAAVYIVDYVYKNLSNSDDYSDGMYISIDDQIVDSEGGLGYSYAGDYTYYPKETPAGAVCYAQACIGVDSPGDFKIYVTEYDTEYNRHKAVFNIDVDAEPVPFADIDTDEPLPPYEGAYRVGDTWTVDGQWSLTITGITETKTRNKYTDLDPAAVYVIDYTYTNLGYENDYADGLYLSIDSCVVDNVGFMGYSYPGDDLKYPKQTPEGATCKAQACVGVWHEGSVQLVVNLYDGTKTEQTAVFYLGEEPEAPAPTAEPTLTGEEKNISQELRDFLANYEDFADEYIEFLTKYLKADPGEMLSLLGDYAEYAEKYADFAAQIKDFDTSKLTKEELAYFREVTDRVTRKLAELLDR